MVKVNILKIFGDTFRENEASAEALARTLSRLPPAERESAILELCTATGLNHVFWRNKLASLGSAKKK